MFKTLIRKTKTVINNPKSVLIKALLATSPLYSDETYLKMLFPLKTGYKLNLDNPQTFNEKLQWLKINYRKPIMTKMVDKYEAKEFARKIIGDEYIIKNYGVWDSFDEINFDTLPKQFVLKTTHDQGGVVIVKDKSKFDKKSARKKLHKHLRVKHYYLTREWPYKNVKPRILAEEYLEDNNVDDLYDYKFFCFNGEPKIMYISSGKNQGRINLDHYDLNFNYLNIKRIGNNYTQAGDVFSKPPQWSRMIELAEKLSVDIPLVRVDFFLVNNKIYLGEITFYQGGGMEPFVPHEWDKKLGDWIDLSDIK